MAGVDQDDAVAFDKIAGLGAIRSRQWAGLSRSRRRDSFGSWAWPRGGGIALESSPVLRGNAVNRDDVAPLSGGDLFVVMRCEINDAFFRNLGRSEIGRGRAVAGHIGSRKLRAEISLIGGRGDRYGISDQLEISIPRLGRKFGSQRITVRLPQKDWQRLLAAEQVNEQELIELQPTAPSTQPPTQPPTQPSRKKSRRH